MLSEETDVFLKTILAICVYTAFTLIGFTVLLRYTDNTLIITPILVLSNLVLFFLIAKVRIYVRNQWDNPK